MRDPMFPSLEFQNNIKSRRIQGWDESGNPIGGLKPQTKEPRITTLSAHYGALADTVAAGELKQAQEEIEQVFLDNAKKGKRVFIFYPSQLVKKYRGALTKWMQDDGVVVNWTEDQRDGHSIEVSY